MELTDVQRAALMRLAQMEVDPLCPRCGHRAQDPRSDYGWCVRCDAAHERVLEAKRRWWRENRGKEAVS